MLNDHALSEVAHFKEVDSGGQVRNEQSRTSGNGTLRPDDLSHRIEEL